MQTRWWVLSPLAGESQREGGHAEERSGWGLTPSPSPSPIEGEGKTRRPLTQQNSSRTVLGRSMLRPARKNPKIGMLPRHTQGQVALRNRSRGHTVVRLAPLHHYVCSVNACNKIFPRSADAGSQRFAQGKRLRLPWLQNSNSACLEKLISSILH